MQISVILWQQTYKKSLSSLYACVKSSCFESRRGGVWFSCNELYFQRACFPSDLFHRKPDAAVTTPLFFQPVNAGWGCVQLHKHYVTHCNDAIMCYRNNADAVSAAPNLHPHNVVAVCLFSLLSASSLVQQDGFKRFVVAAFYEHVQTSLKCQPPWWIPPKSRKAITPLPEGYMFYEQGLEEESGSRLLIPRSPP